MNNKTIWLNVWTWYKDPDKKLILYEGQVPFPASPTFSNEWSVEFSFEAINPLFYPIPTNQELFYAFHSKTFPYNVVDVYPVINSLQTQQKGTYFIAYTTPLKHVHELPWNNVYVSAVVFPRLKP